MFFKKLKYWFTHDDGVAERWEKRLLLVISLIAFGVIYSYTVPQIISLIQGL